MFKYVSKHIIIVLNLNLRSDTFTHQSFTNTQYLITKTTIVQKM